MKYIYTTIIILFISSCMSQKSQIDKSQYTKKQYEIIKKREEFIKNTEHILKHKLDEKSLINFINLPVLDQYMIFILPIKKTFNKIHYVEKIQKDKLNINDILIPNQDYFYDSVNNELLLAFKLPYIYLLDEHIKFTTHIVGSKKQKIIKKDIIFNFEYKPMQKSSVHDTKTNHPSFQYTTFSNKNLNENIKEKLKNEFNNINLGRLNNKYKNTVLKINKRLKNEN